MAFAGVSAEIKQSSGKYRVVSGPYASKRQAQNDKNKLLQQKIANCWIP
jgi:cell division protein FtsN